MYYGTRHLGILHLIELQFTKQVINNTKMPFTQLNVKWYKILEQSDTP